MLMSRSSRALYLSLFLWLACASRSAAQTAEPSPRERDRGDGIPVSMFATFIEKGDLIIYPFFEYYYDDDTEYSPQELGYDLDQDFRGKYRATEELLFVGYGITDWLAVEVEAAIIQAELETSADDPTAIPDKVEESGLGDVEGQFRWRWAEERARRPLLHGYFEIVGPTQDEGSLIGTTDWEFKFGSGAMRSYGWGTASFRAAVEYSKGEDKFELGELALEGHRRFNRHSLVYAGVEGSEDEWELIAEYQWTLLKGVTLKLNNAFAFSSKATDWAPEVGIVLRFPRRESM